MTIAALIPRALLLGLFMTAGALPALAQEPQETPTTKQIEQKAADDKAVAKENAGDVPADDDDEKYFKLFQEFVDTFEQIDRNFVHDVDRRELMEAAIRGMLTELDPYSSYIPPDAMEEFEQGIEQEFGGIGIQVHVDPQTRRLTVVTPIPGTPAYKGGVLAGDVIMKVNGKSTEGFTIQDAVDALKGKPGEEVTIGVLHKGSDEIESLQLTRAVIHVPTVLGDHYKENGEWDFMLDDEHKIGYVRITHFSRDTSEELHKVLESLTKQGMRGFILDLRFNPGGLLGQAIQVVDFFLEEGVIVSTKGRNVPSRSWSAHEAGTFSGFPMVVLVNHYSASASEIVSAALQDHDRAQIIGARTWGKGSVQNVIDLNGGSAALKLTTATYRRPSGKNIHRFPDDDKDDVWGVMPDKGYRIPLNDNEMREFILNRRSQSVVGAEPSSYVDKQRKAALDYLYEQLGITEKADSHKKAKPSKKAPQKAPQE